MIFTTAPQFLGGTRVIVRIGRGGQARSGMYLMCVAGGHLHSDTTFNNSRVDPSLPTIKKIDAAHCSSAQVKK